MARVRRTEEEIARRPPPPWYRDVWPWLLALGLVVLAIVVGAIAYQAYQDDDDGSETATVAETTTADDESGTTTEATTTVEEPPEIVTVPDVVGSNHVEAGSSVEAQGLAGDSYPVASSEPRGSVVAQRPPAGTQLEEGETVRMNVALGDEPREAREVPDVTGPQASDARSSLRRAGFTVRTLYRQPPSSEEIGEVLTQEPAPGTSAPDLTQVTIFVGRQ
jgi:eukaryotic-like serine/threonine-protein kinase